MFLTRGQQCISEYHITRIVEEQYTLPLLFWKSEYTQRD